MIAGQAFDAKAETAAERWARNAGTVGLDNEALFVTLKESGGNNQRPSPVLLEVSEPEVHQDPVSPGSTGGAADRCGLQGSPLSPELRQLVARFCPPENAGQAGYCACVKRYIEVNGSEVQAQARKEDMLRIGYQFYLEDWAKRYQASILAFRRQETSFLASMPPQCKPSELMTGVMQKIRDVNSCRGNADAFSKAFNKILRFDGTNVLDVSQLGSATDERLLYYINRKAQFNRFYVSPDQKSNTTAPRDFVDCMSPSSKRAFALIPVKWGDDDIHVELRRTNLTNVTTAISSIHDLSLIHI